MTFFKNFKNSLWYESWKILKRNHLALIGMTIIIFLILIAIFADFIAPYSYKKATEVDLTKSEQFISFKHLLGTDLYGRDILSRIIYGSRISMQVAIISQGIASIIGVILGLLAGFYGGKVDLIIMKITEIFLAFPFLLFVLTIVSIMGSPSITIVFVAMGVVGWPYIARLVRGSVLSLKEKEFVEAARALGSSNLRIIFLHILPNTMAPIIIQVTLGMAFAILSEAGLSFLGFGAQAPQPSWGLMIADGQDYLQTSWWIAIFPGIAIVIAIYGFNLFGDGLRDALDPKMKK
jgi:ABC-type dipeptide/oligopeptide/nickel transport system permease subunit